MTTAVAPAGPAPRSAPGSSPAMTPHHDSDLRGQLAPGADVCSDGLSSLDCPFCWGPESD
jgi:hypothetical protein